MKRILFLDYLRMTACLMVMLVHACDNKVVTKQECDDRSVQ